MSTDPVSMLTGGLVDSSGNFGGLGALTGGLTGSSSGGLPGLGGLGNMLPGLGSGGLGGLGGFGMGGAGGMNFLNPMSMFGNMMGGTGSKIPSMIPQAYQIPSSYRPGTYNFGNQNLPTQTTPQAAPVAPTVNMMQTPRQVPQGQATGSVNNLTPQYNSAVAYGR